MSIFFRYMSIFFVNLNFSVLDIDIYMSIMYNQINIYGI